MTCGARWRRLGWEACQTVQERAAGGVGCAVSDSGGRKAVVQRGVEVGHQASASPERAAAVRPLDLVLMRVGGLTFCRRAFEAAFGERVFRCRKGRAPADSWGEGSGAMTEERGEVACDVVGIGGQAVRAETVDGGPIPRTRCGPAPFRERGAPCATRCTTRGNVGKGPDRGRRLRAELCKASTHDHAGFRQCDPRSWADPATASRPCPAPPGRGSRGGEDGLPPLTQGCARSAPHAAAEGLA